MYALTRDGANVGFVDAADAPTIKAIGEVFTHAGDHITMLKKYPTAFTFYKNWQTSMDSDLLGKCSARLSFRPTPASSSSAESKGGSGASSPVAACFKTAGAYVKGPQAAGPGLAIYAVTRDGRTMGFVKAADAVAIKAIRKAFTEAGDHVTMLKKDPTAFMFYKGTVTKTDSDLLTKCSGRPSGLTAALSTSASSEGTGATSSPVAACFKAAGAYVKGPQAAGPGSAIYAVTPDGATLGFVKAADAVAIKAIGKAFTRAGDHVTMLKKNPPAFGFYKQTLTKKDSDLLRTCSARG